MLARCLSASLQGLEARPVVVEVDLAPGLPGVQLVCLPDKAIQESRERVRSALRNSGFRGPLVRVVINLAPADLRKEGPSFDLPIALALLVASGQLARPRRAISRLAAGRVPSQIGTKEPIFRVYFSDCFCGWCRRHHFRWIFLYIHPK